MRSAFALGFVVAAGCTSGASAHLELANQTTGPFAPRALVGGTSLRLKMLSVSLAPDVDPVTMDNLGTSAIIWLNPQCGGDNDGCNVDGFAEPAGPRVTDYFDLSRTSAEIDADLASEDRELDPGTYRYARVDLCKALGGQTEATVPTLMWKAEDMAGEQPFTSGDCGRTSLEFDPPLVLAAGDRVGVQLGYDLAQAIMTGAPADAGAVGCSNALAGLDHCFRACVDVSASERACMDFPDFAPTAVKE